MTFKVGITGSRHWMPRKIMWPILDTYFNENPDMLLIVGDADGADADAIIWAEIRGCPYKKYEADWSVGKAGGNQRNSKMVDENSDAKVWLAFPLPSSKGTYDCMRKAKAKGIEVKEFSFV